MGSKRTHNLYRYPEWCTADHDDHDERPDDLPEDRIRHYGGMGGSHPDNLLKSARDRPLGSDWVDA